MTETKTSIGKARLDHWRKFQSWIDDHSDSAWAFRGLGDAAFALTPTVGRIPNYLLARERAILAAFRRRIPQFGSAAAGAWDELALAQHHGVPTRLLDWTTNPLVAARFAVASPPGEREIETADGIIAATPARNLVDCKVVAYRVRPARMIDPEDIADPFAVTEVAFVLPRAVSSRIASQSGIFTIHPQPSIAWDAPMTDKHVFTIPGAIRDFFLNRLFYLGVDPLYLMGGLDGLGSRLAWQASRGVGLGAIT